MVMQHSIFIFVFFYVDRIGTGQNYTNSFSFNDNTDALGSLSQRIDDKKTDSNEKWNILMKELNNEKQRNQSLNSSFLPRHSAAILSQGQMPKGGMYCIVLNMASVFSRIKRFRIEK